MKKIIMPTLLVIAVGLLITLLYISIKNAPTGVFNCPQTEDTINVTTCNNIVAVQNVTFENIGDVIQLQQQAIEAYAVDSTLRNIPAQVLTNVATVLLKKHDGPLTLLQLCNEYYANQNVYDNLPTVKTEKDKPDAAMEEQPITKDEGTLVSAQTKDTVIDGKRYRSETKTVKYE